jgi:hypothetical protein
VLSFELVLPLPVSGKVQFMIGLRRNWFGGHRLHTYTACSYLSIALRNLMPLLQSMVLP